MDPARALKLNRLFDAICRGKTPVNPQNGPLFLESICAHLDPAACISKIITSTSGLEAIQASFRFNLTPAFFDGGACRFLMYIQAPELKDIGGGELLNQIVQKVVEPPIFWGPFSHAFKNGTLQARSQLCFAWLLHRLVVHPGSAPEYRVQAIPILGQILSSSQVDVRTLGQRIKVVIDAYNTGSYIEGEIIPGGRHDNDFSDFRKIAILPTADEIMSPDPPFLRDNKTLGDLLDESTALPTHIDNQFRLLREDMLYELREELQIAFGKKKRHHRGLVIDKLKILDLHCGTDERRCKWGIMMKCGRDLPLLASSKNRTKFLQDNRNFLRHQSICCLIVGGEVVAFPTINRDEDLLVSNPPILVLQLEGEASITKTLLKIKLAGDDVKLIQIDTAIFSYYPILYTLQHINAMPLSPELLLWSEGKYLSEIDSQPVGLVHALREDSQRDLQQLLNTPKPIKLDESQAASLNLGLTQKVALIQGPPGTGKSFIGALITKALHDQTKKTILVVCYTNHALDDILTSLLDIGIPTASMVRLGGKSTSRTEPLTLSKQNSSFRRDKTGWLAINALKHEAEVYYRALEERFHRYNSAEAREVDILNHLEFEESDYYEAFRVPQSSDGLVRVGRRGRAVGPYYLLGRWINGWDAGIFKSDQHIKNAAEIWIMPRASRGAQLAKWKSAIFHDQIEQINAAAKGYNSCQDKLARQWADKETAILRSKRIIGCTTTAAAKYGENLRAACPDVLLVEEAGEILESHVLAALGSQTKQLVMIGDHKQLRPKVKNYQLTVEKGEGYDLNQSLFERLILKGYPHVTLSEQHRMRPEISALIRNLTYPELVDASSTKGRPDLRGAQDNIIFINHDHPEDDDARLADCRDGGATSSKQNTYEATMVLKILRYLAQQGYGTDTIVILTPYLGQLHKLRLALQKDNDPILNDLDSYDLVNAGLLSPAAAKVLKKPIRLATIDNYQGEESDIVIISLTRSNKNYDIGFMSSPERLNVLLSRARNSIIMLGNAETFMNARKGKELWTKLFGLLKLGKHIYEGMPAQCERHSDFKVILREPADFDTHCPDGGCTRSCGAKLSCGLHNCPSKCHQLYDHSKMPCKFIMHTNCPVGHHQSWMCHENMPTACLVCEREAKLAEGKRRGEFEKQQKRDAEQTAHAHAMAELEEQIEQQTQAMKDERLAKEREDALAQKRTDLANALSFSPSDPARTRGSETRKVQRNIKSTPQVNSPGPANLLPMSLNIMAPHVPHVPQEGVDSNNSQPSSSVILPLSPSEQEWERQKNLMGEQNDSIDCIMAMTGLEQVKEQVLNIKAVIEAKTRQNASFKQERFNIALLGNPGTGKTTVARHYAKFLASYKVLPGDMFIETTGSRLANDGIDAIKKHIENVLNAGGGTIFVDEAYQLTIKHNFQGGPVLDFLLAEMENNVGTLVFVLAGYNKEMEKFFEHNPGLQSRIPFQVQFEDYTDDELLRMFISSIYRRFQGRMKLEDGPSGLYARIATRRLGRGRGQNGFGNARALENMLARILRRQAKRLNEERAQGLIPDDFVLLKEDIIGPDPSKVMVKNQAWEKLQSLTGLKAVKESIQNLIHLINTNYRRELEEKKPVQMSLNRVFLGSPGTGKTTVAQLYGQILADLNLISSNEVVLKNPADFIGSVLGESEMKTKAILANTVGKVLIIDEAYMLYGGGGVEKSNDPYKTAVIDTIVAEVQSVLGEDRCVLLLGYKDQITEMFQNVNAGLSRRFDVENAFHFEDFTNPELREILDLKLKHQDLAATDAAKDVAIRILDRARNHPNFGNAGEVENLLGQAKNHFQTRQASIPLVDRPFDIVFEPQDFDLDFDRDAHALTSLATLFGDVVGCEEIVDRLAKYQKLAQVLKARGISPHDQIPTNFVFKGPPGTGKTSIARKMGQVYYDMGFLSSTKVVECSASDLVGNYVGQTGGKTRKLFEKALGQVLFIDEAYRLSEGTFAKEAIDEVVGLLTHPNFKSKLIVILAGYDEDMDRLMTVNTGLASRFPQQIPFRDMQPSYCLEVMNRELKRNGVILPELDDPSSASYLKLLEVIAELSSLPLWGNARDMLTLAKEMISRALLADLNVGSQVILSRAEALECAESMLAERKGRHYKSKANMQTTSSNIQKAVSPPALARSLPLQPSQHITSTRIAEAPSPVLKKILSNPEARSDERDAGVTDEVWNHLQACKKAEEDVATRLKEDIQHAVRNKHAKAQRIKSIQELTARLNTEVAKDKKHKQKIKRQQEEARRKELAAQEALAKAKAVLEAKRKEEQERKMKEQKAQAALHRMGVCVAGFRWINEGSGYRCAGGAHFVSNEQLGNV